MWEQGKKIQNGQTELRLAAGYPKAYGVKTKQTALQFC